MDFCREVRNLLSHEPKVDGAYAFYPSEELLAVNDEITHHYEQLHGHSHQRHSLLKMLGVSVNRDGLAQVFTWLPAVQKAAAQQLWQRLEQKAERCKAYNDKNGELLIRQCEFIQSFLGSEADFSIRNNAHTFPIAEMDFPPDCQSLVFDYKKSRHAYCTSCTALKTGSHL